MARKRGRRQRTGVIGLASTWLRRIRRIALAASIAMGIYRWWRSGPGRKRGISGGGPSGPGDGGGRRAPVGGPRSPSPLRAAATPDTQPEGQPVAAVATAVGTAERVGDAWIAPLEDGSCPLSHPVKVNESSGIFHVPGGRSYDRTQAGRCYATPEAAAADGFRAAKS
jgi:hypothetical protein